MRVGTQLDGNGNGKSHAKLVIARAHNYEQHLQAQATYLEVRQRLKKILMQLQDVTNTTSLMTKEGIRHESFNRSTTHA